MLLKVCARGTMRCASLAFGILMVSTSDFERIVHNLHMESTEVQQSEQEHL
jgi:hypothetical protein